MRLVVKKTDVFDIGPYKGRIQIDFTDIVRKWRAWRKKCKDSKGEDIGVINPSNSLFLMLSKHGVVGRKVYKKGGKKEQKEAKTVQGGSEVIRLCKDLFDKQDFSPEIIEEIQVIQRMLESMSEDNSPLNPKNMAYRAVVSWSPSPKLRGGEVQTWEDGTPKHDLDHQTVFGHYRTTEYVEYRREIRNKQEPDANTTWYSEGSPGNAKPPMWQALFGDGTGSLKFEDSLKTIIDEAMSAISNAQVEILSSTPVRISGKGAGEAAYNQIGEIKDWFDAAVRDPAYRTPNGNFSTTRAQSYWKKNYVRLDEASEQSVMKQIMQSVTENYPLDIVSVPVFFPRNQIKHMARLAGFEPPVKQEENDGLVEDTVEKMDWRMVLAI